MSKQYNYCLDFVKGIACIFVVLMHCEFPGLLGTAVQAISRFCVPLFFMVSGFFCYETSLIVVGAGGNLLIYNKIKHIARITASACLFYTAFMLIVWLLGKNINWSISKFGLFSWLVFNQPAWAGVAGQYWFLFALLYTYIFYYVLSRFGWIRQAYWLAGLMFMVYVVMAQGMHLAGIAVPNMIYRNWLVEGFAYFMLGHWMCRNQEKLKMDSRLLLAIVFFSTLLCLAERYMLGRDFGVNIVTIPQVFCLFLYAVNNPSRHKGFIQEIGKRYSMFVYVIHPAIWRSLEMIYGKLDLRGNLTALYVMPILVVVLTLCASHIVYMFNTRRKLAAI